MHTPITPARIVDQPTPGFFKMRLVRRGPWVPAAITYSVFGLWQATIDGEIFAADADPVFADGVLRVWHSGRFIDEAEYAHMLAVKAWAGTTMPDHPAAQPRKAMDISKLRPLF